MTALSDYLSERKRIDGLSVREFARRCEISQTTAQRLLTGASVPDYATLEKVAAKLPAPLNKLVELSGVERPEPFILGADADKLTDRQRRHVRALVREFLIASGEIPSPDDDPPVTRLAVGTPPRDRARVLRVAKQRRGDTESDEP